jgi:hypothetical protein
MITVSMEALHGNHLRGREGEGGERVGEGEREALVFTGLSLIAKFVLYCYSLVLLVTFIEECGLGMNVVNTV